LDEIHCQGEKLILFWIWITDFDSKPVLFVIVAIVVYHLAFEWGVENDLFIIVVDDPCGSMAPLGDDEVRC
jgi:hypothetical protein